VTGGEHVVCVYGIVPADRVPAGSSGDHVDTVVHGPLAAVVAAASADRPLGADELRMHDAVVAGFVERGVPILPMRFGSAVADVDTVIDEILAAKADSLVAALEELSGRRQYTLQVRYEQDGVLRRVLARDPRIEAARVAASGPRASGSDRIRLGQLVAAAIERRRGSDARVIADALAPWAERQTTTVASDSWGVASIACLVDVEREDAFVEAAEALAEQHAEFVRLRLLGPLAPYDFVPDV
jgi:hypothetical protein